MIQSKRDFSFATFTALIMYQQNSKLLDRDAISEYKSQLEISQPNDRALRTIIYFYLFQEEYRLAEKTFNRLQSDNSATLVAQAFVTSYKTNNHAEAYEILNQATQKFGATTIEGLFAKVYISTLLRKYTITIDCLNDLIYDYPSLFIAKVEKAKILMMIADWEQSMELTESILLEDDPENIIAQELMCFNLLVREGDIEEFQKQFLKLQQLIEVNEPNNIELMLSIAQLFSRIAGKNQTVISSTMSLVQQCRKIDPLHPYSALELAEEQAMLKDFEQAYYLYQEVASLDDQLHEALYGMIFCRIQQGQIEDAKCQLEFVIELNQSGDRTPFICYLQSLLEKNSMDEEGNQMDQLKKSLGFVDEGLKKHIAMTKTLPAGFDFYVKLNPYFLMCIAEEYLQQLTLDKIINNETISNSFITKGIKLLQTITKQIPGLASAHLLLAKARLAMGEQSIALDSIKRCLNMQPNHQEAAILSAIIQKKNGNTQGAQDSLQSAIANNFQIRENPYFMLVKGQMEYANSNYETAMETLKIAYEIVETSDKGELSKKSQGFNFGEQERCLVYVMLAKSYNQMKEYQESQDLITKTITEFAGTPQEVNVIIANSEIALEKGDIKKALSILKGVDTTSLYYKDAQKIMANIYLNHLKDRRHYAQCFYNILLANENLGNYLELGNALMKIQEPEEAFKVYSKAKEIDPNDKTLIRNMGKCLIKMHSFKKALKYYQNAINLDKNRLDLLIDMAELCILTQQYKAVETYISEKILDNDFEEITLERLQLIVQGYQTRIKLFYKINPEKRENPQVKQSISKAIDYQQKVIEKCKTDGGNTKQERQILNELYFESGKYYETYEQNDRQAQVMYEKALKNNKESLKYLESVIRVLRKLNDRESCLQKCQQYLNLSPNDQYAQLVLSDIVFEVKTLKESYEAFVKYWNDKTNSYAMLSKIIEILRLGGKIDQAKIMLEKAEKQSPTQTEPGLCFCQGLYNKYMRNSHLALEKFFKVKDDPVYKEVSIYHMIDIYLNPNQELFFTQADSSCCTKNIEPTNVQVADQLLKSIKSPFDQKRYTSYEALILMFSRNKTQFESGASMLLDLIKRYSYIPALFNFAVSKALKKKFDDASQLLEQIIKNSFSNEFADDFEKALLHLADMAINKSLYQEAKQHLIQCLQINNSSGKAAELLGYLSEKQSNFVEACRYYEVAWKLTNCKSTSICFRLAFAYFKSEKYPQSVDSCKALLKLQPNYPKVEKEILEKALQNLRLTQ